MSTHTGVVIDASLRFARSHPQVLRFARESAPAVGMSADDLLRDAIARVTANCAAHTHRPVSGRDGRPLLRVV